jgi:hypothetical protein
MTDRIVGKLGKLAPKRPEGLHMFAYYQTSPLPAAPESVAVPAVENWQMLGNDQYGDCTFAGIVHAMMATAAAEQETETFPTADEVVNAYLTYTNGQDAGAVEADLLAYWKNTGIFGKNIPAYAPTDHADFDELKSVIATFGLAYIGIQVPTLAQQQFAEGQPWALSHTPADNQIEGGHCIILVGYDNDYVECITWGKVQEITWEWLRAYIEESWAIITPEIVEKGLYGDLRLPDLLTDLEKLS